MFEYRKRRRELEREIAKAEEQSVERVKVEKLDMLPLGVAQDRFLRDHCKMELEILESDHLANIAGKFGLDYEFEGAWYDPKMHGVQPRSYFTVAEKAQLRRMVGNARFSWWSKWAMLLATILSLLIASLALLKR
jgi:hypothetical protein